MVTEEARRDFEKWLTVLAERKYLEKFNIVHF